VGSWGMGIDKAEAVVSRCGAIASGRCARKCVNFSSPCLSTLALSAFESRRTDPRLGAWPCPKVAQRWHGAPVPCVHLHTIAPRA
jgi:hypothetical protein